MEARLSASLGGRVCLGTEQRVNGSREGGTCRSAVDGGDSEAARSAFPESPLLANCPPFRGDSLGINGVLTGSDTGQKVGRGYLGDLGKLVTECPMHL